MSDYNSSIKYGQGFGQSQKIYPNFKTGCKGLCGRQIDITTAQVFNGYCSDCYNKINK